MTGSTSAFDDFVAARWDRFVRSAVLLGCGHHEAEDVVQSTLTRCLLHWRRVERAEDRDAYVYRVLLNTFTSQRRRRWTTERVTDKPPDRAASEDPFAVADVADAVRRCLDRLPEKQRTAVVLRYYAHLSEAQMADVLGVALGTVKSRLFRATTQLAADPDLIDLRGSK